MRPAYAALMATALLLTGCLVDPVGSEAAPRVEPATFQRAEADWVAMYAGGCGICTGMGGFGPAENLAVFLFENGRALLVRFNTASSGEGAFQVAPDITYDADELEALLEVVPRAEGETWVVNVTTGRVEPEAFPARARALFEEPSESRGCEDYGATYGVRTDAGEARLASVVCPVGEGDPLHGFADAMHALRDALLALDAPMEAR